MDKILTISELTGNIKSTLETTFDSIKVAGEISNFKPHVSGHWYFTLKDDAAQISCTMWKGVNNYVFFTPEDGMKVVVTGKISVYAPRGSYQLDVKSMKPAGVGDLQLAFEKLKQRLHQEGLFDLKYKKKLPLFPSKIGLVTASDGAAIKDMISVAARRYPSLELIIAASRVQGEGAAEDIADNLNRLNNFGVDVIIVARGGGSIEDLWAFNEEIVARAIFDSKIPVISGVGHESDFTIADFVADVRAATPTAAMELATPDVVEIVAFINDFLYNSDVKIRKNLRKLKDSLDAELSSYAFRNPFNIVRKHYQQVDNLFNWIEKNIEIKMNNKSNKINHLCSVIKMADHKFMLKKGYSITRQNNRIVTSANDLDVGSRFEIEFYDNKVKINDDKKN